MLFGCYTDHLLFTIVRKLRVFTIELYKKLKETANHRVIHSRF